MDRLWLALALIGASGCVMKRMVASGESTAVYKLKGTEARVEREIEAVCGGESPREVWQIRRQASAPSTSIMTTTSSRIEGSYLVTTTTQTPITLTSLGWLHVEVTCEDGYQGQTRWRYGRQE